jgi:hypothetical protein
VRLSDRIPRAQRQGDPAGLQLCASSRLIRSLRARSLGRTRQRGTHEAATDLRGRCGADVMSDSTYSRSSSPTCHFILRRWSVRPRRDTMASTAVMRAPGGLVAARCPATRSARVQQLAVHAEMRARGPRLGGAGWCVRRLEPRSSVFLVASTGRHRRRQPGRARRLRRACCRHRAQEFHARGSEWKRRRQAGRCREIHRGYKGSAAADTGVDGGQAEGATSGVRRRCGARPAGVMAAIRRGTRTLAGAAQGGFRVAPSGWPAGQASGRRGCPAVPEVRTPSRNRGSAVGDLPVSAAED